MPGGSVSPAANANVAETGVEMGVERVNYLVGLVPGTNVCAQPVSSKSTRIGLLINLGNNPGLPLEQATMVFGYTNYLVAWSENSITSGLGGRFVLAPRQPCCAGKFLSFR